MSRRHKVNSEAPRPITRMAMTAADVRMEYEKALDAWNIAATKNRDVALAYEQEFKKQERIADAYDSQNFLLDLTLGEKFGPHVREYSALLTALMYWERKAQEYRVNEAIVVCGQDDPYWWQMLDDSHPNNPSHMPTTGQVFDLGKNSGEIGTASGSGRKRSSVVRIQR